MTLSNNEVMGRLGHSTATKTTSRQLRQGPSKDHRSPRYQPCGELTSPFGDHPVVVYCLMLTLSVAICYPNESSYWGQGQIFPFQLEFIMRSGNQQ
jgi:hypothetical protein